MPKTKEASPQQHIDWHELIQAALNVPGAMGDTYCRFYNYSYMNQILLLMQGVTEPVATYKKWQSMGRQVLRGSTAKQIVRPLVIEKKTPADEVEERKVLFKPVRCLFTVSDTEGEPLPAFEAPSWDYERALAALDITEAPYRLMDGNTQGYSWDRNVAINPVAVYPNKTRAHEMGHIVLGHTVGNGIEQYKTHRGVMEFGAEATAYLTMNELGQLPEATASESRAYIQGWLQGSEPPTDIAIRQVFSSTDQILKAGRPVAEEVAELLKVGDA